MRAGLITERRRIRKRVSSQVWQFLKQNKDLFLYTLLVFFVYLVLILCIVLGIDAYSGHISSQSLVWLGLLSYLAFAFVSVFSHAVLMKIILSRLRGKPLRFGQAYAFVLARAGRIFQWTLVVATVGSFFRVLENNRSRGAAGALGLVLVLILGFSWALASFFVLPIVLEQNCGPFAAIKRSVALFGKRGYLRVRSVLGYFAILMGVSVVLVCLAIQAHYFVIGGVLFSLLFLIMVFVSPIATATLQAVLYCRLVQGEDLPGFVSEDLDATLVRGRVIPVD